MENYVFIFRKRCSIILIRTFPGKCTTVSEIGAILIFVLLIMKFPLKLPDVLKFFMTSPMKLNNSTFKIIFII